MKNNGKIIASALILAGMVSLLFFVVPITETFVVSYIFTLVAIAGIAFSLAYYKKAVTDYAFIYTAIGYGVISVIFSVIACVFTFNIVWTIIVHLIILGFFAIRTIALKSGSEYIDEMDKQAEEKHNEFLKEKENYWR